MSFPIEQQRRSPKAKASGPIKLKTRYKPGFRRLPFVANWRSKSDTPCWDIPATGNYFGGHETGEAMALAFLKFLREGDEVGCGRWLISVVESFMIRFEQEGGGQMVHGSVLDMSDGFSSFRGQYCGFFGLLSNWLWGAAKDLGANLDQITEKDLVCRANAGLNFDSHAFFKASLATSKMDGSHD